MTVIGSAMLLLATWPVAALVVKVTLVFALGLIAARCASRASTSHVILASALAASVLVPVVEGVAPPRVIAMTSGVMDADVDRVIGAIGMGGRRPGATSQRNRQPNGTERSTPPEPAGDASPWLPLFSVVFVVWLAGAVIVTASLAIDVRRVRVARRNGVPDAALSARLRGLARSAGVSANVEVIVSTDVSGPLVTGVATPAILLPPDANTWSDDGLLHVVTHEMEHVRRADWLLHVSARAVCALYWFHPLVWMIWRRLCLAAERACDDAVMKVGDPASYAEQLVALARRRPIHAAEVTLGMAGRTNLSVRVRALLDPRVRRGPTSWLVAATTAATFAGLVAVVAPLRAERLQPVGPDTAETPQHEAAPVTPIDLELYEASTRGPVAVVADLIARGGRVDAAIASEGSPLIGAVRSGRLDVVRVLLAHGANPNLAVPHDGNPMIVAARAGQVPIIQALLDAGARVNDVVPDDETALMGASHEGHLAVVRYLVERGADVNLRAWAGVGPGREAGEWRTPLLMAERGQHWQVAEYLRSVGARQ